MIKLIASDVDGTLLQHGATEIDPELFTIIKKLKDKGIHFVVASGRPLTSLQHLFFPVANDISFIGENGAIYSLNQELHTPVQFDRNLVQDIITTIHKDKGCDITFSCAHTTYMEPKSKEFLDHIQNIAKFKVEIVEDLLHVQELPIKIALSNPVGIDHIVDKYKALFHDRATVVTSGNLWLDFMPLGVNKGIALKRITSSLNVLPQECMAFGDQWNDAEMLKFVGTSYAMSTAVPGISDFCTNSTDSVISELRKLL